MPYVVLRLDCDNNGECYITVISVLQLVDESQRSSVIQKKTRVITSGPLCDAIDAAYVSDKMKLLNSRHRQNQDNNGRMNYTPCFIKTTPYLIAHNFGKCWPIFKKMSPRTQRRSCNELITKGPSHLKGVDIIPCEM